MQGCARCIFEEVIQRHSGAAAPPPAQQEVGRDCMDHASHPEIVDEPRLAEAGGDEEPQRPAVERLGARQ